MIRIIVPVYNEEDNIKSCLYAAVANLQKEKYIFYVIDGGSTDRTLTILRALKRTIPIEIVHQRKRDGIGEAFQLGIEAVIKVGKIGDIVFVLEGDGTSDPKLIPEMARKIRAGDDIVIASRYTKGGENKNYPFFRRKLSNVANLFMRIFVHDSEITDYTIFYRAYRFDILKKAVSLYGNKLITAKHFAANFELLTKLLLFTTSKGEVPYVYDYGTKKGTSKLTVMTNIREYLRYVVLKSFQTAG